MTEQTIQLDQKPYGYIYKITNLANGKVYVGQTRRNLRKRWAQHLSVARAKRTGASYRSYLYLAFDKYGVENFVLEEICVASDLNDLNSKEIYWISCLDTVNPRGYNISPGGGVGNASKETRVKMAQARKGKKLTDEHKANISKKLKEVYKDPVRRDKLIAGLLSHKISPEARARGNANRCGAKRSDVARAKMSAAQKGKKQSPELVAKRAASLKGRKISDWHKEILRKVNTGKKHSDETRRKISIAKKGKKLTEEHLKKLMQANAGRTISEETRTKMGQKHRGKQISRKQRAEISCALRGMPADTRIAAYLKSGEFIGEFISQAECALSLGVSKALVCNCLKMKLNSKRYIFKYMANDRYSTQRAS